jgi:hypothetical protein
LTVMWLATGVERLGIQQTTPLRLHPQSIWVLPGAIWYAEGLDLPRRSLQDDLPQWLDRFSPADHLVQDAVLRLVGGQARAASIAGTPCAPPRKGDGGGPSRPSIPSKWRKKPVGPVRRRTASRRPRYSLQGLHTRPKSGSSPAKRSNPAGHPLGLGKRRRCWNRGASAPADRPRPRAPTC